MNKGSINMETPKSVLKYIELIDRKFEEAKAKKISRFSVEWGDWSRKMNLEVRSIIESNSTDEFESAMLKGILPYWLVTSELLELNLRSRILVKKKIRKLTRDRQNIKDDLFGGDAISEMSLKDLAIRAMTSG